jgi:hypothetical protein
VNVIKHFLERSDVSASVWLGFWDRYYREREEDVCFRACVQNYLFSVLVVVVHDAEVWDLSSYVAQCLSRQGEEGEQWMTNSDMCNINGLFFKQCLIASPFFSW